MAMRIHIYALALLVLITGCSSSGTQGRTDSGPLEEYDPAGYAERKEQLLESLAASSLCNADKGAAVVAETKRLRARAVIIEEDIKALMQGDVLKAFQKEREAFRSWERHQETMSRVLVIYVWEKFVGGSAGGSCQTVYLYDTENLYLEDMDALFGALTGQVSSSFRPVRWPMDILETEEERFKRRIGIPEGRLNAEQKDIRNIVRADVSLFKQWMLYRSQLSAMLPSATSALYDQMTQLIVREHLVSYQQNFIGDENP